MNNRPSVELSFEDKIFIKTCGYVKDFLSEDC